jgi:hypothetical protein
LHPLSAGLQCHPAGQSVSFQNLLV